MPRSNNTKAQALRLLLKKLYSIFRTALGDWASCEFWKGLPLPLGPVAGGLSGPLLVPSWLSSGLHVDYREGCLFVWDLTFRWALRRGERHCVPLWKWFLSFLSKFPEIKNRSKFQQEFYSFHVIFQIVLVQAKVPISSHFCKISWQNPYYIPNR